MKTKSSWRADLTLLGLTALWGGTFVLVKSALAGADPFTFLALRFLLGTAVAAVFALPHLRSAPVWRRGVLLGSILFVAFALQSEGLTLTTPTRSAFVTGLSVAFVPFASFALFRHVPRPSSFFGVVLSVFGLYVMTFLGRQIELGVRIGDLLSLGCALVYAVHIALTEHLSPGVSPTALTAAQLLTVGAFASAARLFTSTYLRLSGGFIFAVAFCGIFASALAISLQSWGQARTSAVRAALIFSLEPLFAALYSSLFAGERLSMREVLGGALMIAGVLVAELGGPLWSGLTGRRSRQSAA